MEGHSSWNFGFWETSANFSRPWAWKWRILGVLWQERPALMDLYRVNCSSDLKMGMGGSLEGYAISNWEGLPGNFDFCNGWINVNICVYIYICIYTYMQLYTLLRLYIGILPRNMPHVVNHRRLSFLVWDLSESSFAGILGRRKNTRNRNEIYTLLGTNISDISHPNALLKIIFLFPRLDILDFWRVHIFCWGYLDGAKRCTRIGLRNCETSSPKM